MPNLPKCHNLDVSAFAQTLNMKYITTANKFLWTLAILDILEKHKVPSNKISFDKISRHMVNIAIPPLYKYHLQFGQKEGKRADQTKNKLDDIFSCSRYKNDMPIFNIEGQLPPGFKEYAEEHLNNYAPYRWLTPFLINEEELKDTKKDCDKNSVIEKLASERFSGKSPVPYRFVKKNEKDFIELNDVWKKYIVFNLDLIKGWAMWKWANFLQDKNPGIPSVVNKLEVSSSSRLPVKEQRNFWNAILRLKKEKRLDELLCIYSGDTISAGERYDLDHYVPWSYIGHCHVWNLIPVARKANRAKGNQLPDTDTYLHSFVEVQYDALWVYHRHFSSDLKTKWKYMIDVYSEHLSLSCLKLIDSDSLHKAYQRVIKSEISDAKKSGFTPNWKLKKK